MLWKYSFLHLFFLPHTLLHFSQVFHDVAYKAKDRNDLVSGIDEFLDQVTVLPPGEWDPTIRIEPPKNVPSQVCTLQNSDTFKRCDEFLLGRIKSH